MTFGFPNSKKNSFRGNYKRKYGNFNWYKSWNNNYLWPQLNLAGRRQGCKIIDFSVFFIISDFWRILNEYIGYILAHFEWDCFHAWCNKSHQMSLIRAIYFVTGWKIFWYRSAYFWESIPSLEFRDQILTVLSNFFRYGNPMYWNLICHITL